MNTVAERGVSTLMQEEREKCSIGELYAAEMFVGEIKTLCFAVPDEV